MYCSRKNILDVTNNPKRNEQQRHTAPFSFIYSLDVRLFEERSFSQLRSMFNFILLSEFWIFYGVVSSKTIIPTRSPTTIPTTRQPTVVPTTMSGSLSVSWELAPSTVFPDNVEWYEAVASSGSGQYLLVTGYLHHAVRYSHDFGTTWQPSLFPKNENMNVSFSSAVSTVLGNLFVLCDRTNSDLYFSDDFGVNFNRSTHLPSGIDSYFVTTTVNHNGSLIYATTSYNLWVSKNFGFNFTIVPAFTSPYSPVYRTIVSDVACDSTGAYILVSIYGYFNNAMENRLSTDFGLTFNVISVLQEYWMSVTMSSTGQHQVMCGLGCFVSSDFGVTFNQTLHVSGGNLVANGADGRFVTVSGSGLNIYISGNYGQTWAEMIPRYGYVYYGLACDSSGQNLLMGLGGSVLQGQVSDADADDVVPSNAPSSAPIANMVIFTGIQVIIVNKRCVLMFR
jgi:hypothetical protein